MVESNYDILGITEGTTEKEIRDAFRRLALQFHSDRGGENEQFIKIKQAYDDLKIGKNTLIQILKKLKILEFIRMRVKRMLEEKIRF